MQQKALLKTRLTQKILKFWQYKRVGNYLLLPFSCIFWLLTRLRYYGYVLGHLQRHFPIPIIVVGNISLGGTGKTPFVIWLAHFLQAQGYKPGIVARGYGGRLKKDQVAQVQRDSVAKEVGDEPLLLAQKCSCPVFVGKERTQAVKQLLASYPDTNVVICDDGLQHYALARDIEIAIVDGNKRLGNGFCLPAGPLRESPARLSRVDFIVVNGVAHQGEWSMQTGLSSQIYAVNDDATHGLLANFINKTVYAFAGIGVPERFFNMLGDRGINYLPRAFPDHHLYSSADFLESKDFPILMTEKDAVKCKQIPLPNAWVVPLEVTLASEFKSQLMEMIK